MKIEINWDQKDSDQLTKLKTDLNEFRETFIRMGTGKIDLSKDECLFKESLRTLIETGDFVDELLTWTESQINTPAQ